MTSFAVTAIGKVESPLTQPESAPRQPDEGAPAAWLVFEPEILEGLQSIRPGDELVLVTWLDRARRDVLSSALDSSGLDSPRGTGAADAMVETFAQLDELLVTLAGGPQSVPES